jgi:hypothetical protein
MRVRSGQVYEFKRGLLDTVLREHCREFADGDLVRVVQLRSAPPPGTMGQVNIQLLRDPEVIGMCALGSLGKRRRDIEKRGY